MKQTQPFYWVSLCLLYALIFSSCLKKEESIGSPTRTNQFKKFTIDDARIYFESTGKELKSTGILSAQFLTKGDLNTSWGHLSSHWNKYLQYEDNRSYIYEIPLSTSTPIGGALITTANKSEHIKASSAKLEQYLVAQKFKDKDTLRYFIISTIGIISDTTTLAQTKNQVSPYNYSGNRSHFQGYMLISDTNGKLLKTFYYKNGHRLEVNLRTYTLSEKPQSINTGFILHKQQSFTKGFNYGSDQFCKFCGEYIGDFACSECSSLDPVIVWSENIPCGYCGEYMPRCICDQGYHPCVHCFSDPCSCDRNTSCPECGDEWCNGECRHSQPPPPYEKPKYTISLIVNGDGSVSGNGEYEEQTNAAISALCGTNTIFGGWSENSTIVSMSTQHSFIVESNRCLTGNFHLRDSDCGKLTLRYKNNDLLKRIITILNNQKAGNNKEHAYLLSSNGMMEYFGGEQGHVNFNFRKYSEYKFIIHNHPSDTPIPSVEDIIALYNGYLWGKLKKESAIIMQTDIGTMSIEIDDFDKFDLFVLNCFGSSQNIKDFNELFYNDILGKPIEDELKNKEIIDKAINFYSDDKGLKIAYTPSNGLTTDWYYASIKNKSLEFYNCIK